MNDQIRLELEWIPWEENAFADYLSKVFDYDDWMLNSAVFQGQLERFNLRYRSPGTEAVDAFTCNWSNVNN